MNIFNIFKIIKEYSKHFFLDQNEKNFIQFQKKKWNLKKKLKNKKKDIVLVELFYWYPLIIFYAFLVNVLSKKQKLEIRYFYFSNKFNHFLNFLIFNKLKKIYASFGCKNGVSIFDLNNNKRKYYEKLFYSFNFTKKTFLKFKRSNILIGDLIYDSYLSKYQDCTVRDINDEKLVSLFVEANLIFDLLFNYFKKHNIKYIIPSHCVYMQHTLASRISRNFNSKNIIVYCKGMATSNFSLKLLNKKKILFDYDYFDYKKKFNKFSKTKKIKALKIGKKIITDRFKGKIDSSIPYMRVSGYKRYKKINSVFLKNSKKKIVLFSHDFFDEPHRYRNMIFNDFYEFVYKTAIFISKLSDEFELYIKPHPNQLEGNDKFYLELKKQFSNNKNIFFFNKDIDNNSIIFSKPDIALTVHGTIAHELAYKNIITINAGDNPHVNYEFNLHPKNEKEYFALIKNAKKKYKKIKFNKKRLYEFIYMHFYYHLNSFDREKLIKDEYFVSDYFYSNNKLVHKRGDNSILFKKYLKKEKDCLISDNVEKYINNFIKQNKL
jgi:hypothetical protein